MRWIKIPEAVCVGPTTVTFRGLVRDVWTADASFGVSVGNLRAGLRILKAFEDERAVVVLDEADWVLLCDAAKNPRVPYNPVIMLHALSLVDVLLEAPDQEPAAAKHVRKPAA